MNFRKRILARLNKQADSLGYTYTARLSKNKQNPQFFDIIFKPSHENQQAYIAEKVFEKISGDYKLTSEYDGKNISEFLQNKNPEMSDINPDVPFSRFKPILSSSGNVKEFPAVSFEVNSSSGTKYYANIIAVKTAPVQTESDPIYNKNWEDAVERAKESSNFDAEPMDYAKYKNFAVLFQQKYIETLGPFRSKDEAETIAGRKTFQIEKDESQLKFLDNESPVFYVLYDGKAGSIPQSSMPQELMIPPYKHKIKLEYVEEPYYDSQIIVSDSSKPIVKLDYEKLRDIASEFIY